MCLIALIEEAGDCAATGLRDTIFGLPEFWVGHCFTHSSHSAWQQVFTTTSQSCTAALKEWTAKFMSGSIPTKACLRSSFRSHARRTAVAHNIAAGVLARRNVPEAAIASALKLARQGAYDDDIDKLVSEHSDDIGDSVHAVDDYLVEACSLVVDTIEQGQCPPTQEECERAEVVSTVGSRSIDVAVKFREDLDHDVETLLSTRSNKNTLKDELATMEKAFADQMSKAIGPAMSGLVEKFFPMLPFRADDEHILKHLQQDVEDRVARIAEIAECETSDVLRVAFFDLPCP